MPSSFYYSLGFDLLILVGGVSLVNEGVGSIRY